MKGEDKKTNTIKMLDNEKEDLRIIRYDIQIMKRLNRTRNNKEAEIIIDSAIEKPDLSIKKRVRIEPGRARLIKPKL